MATPLPTPAQLRYQDWELGLFLHFGLRTFYEGWEDMDKRPMSPAAFDPTQLDCRSWAEAAKKAGFGYMVMTTKHHCGFANWPSKTTDFSVASSPWKRGKGDVVREFTDACREFGLGVGLYYSPFDAASPVYGDAKAYDDYFIAQIGEILEPYGRIDILWFDGCGSAGHEYDWPRILAEIRRMQPDVLLFNADGIRWVGNEDGYAPLGTRNVVPGLGNSMVSADATPLWLPAECDCRMRWRRWFYSDADANTVKSVDELMGMYYYSVGRGCTMLLNIGPDRRGLLPDADRTRLLEFGDEIRRRFGSPLATLRDFTRDGNSWEYTSKTFLLVDHVVVAEDIAKGEHVFRFAIHAGAQEAITVYEGRTVGHKTVCRFPPIRTRGLRFEVIEAEGDVELRALELHGTCKDTIMVPLV